MKLLHVVPTYWPAFRYGGPIHSVHGLCRALVKLGHEVEVFTTNIDGPGELEVPVGESVDVDGVQVTYWACPRVGRRLYRAPAMGRALAERVSEFDLVHGHSVFLWPTLAASRSASLEGVPWVLSPRGMLVRDLVRSHGRMRKQAWIRMFERRSIRTAAFVHATSEVEARELVAMGTPAAKLEVIPNGVHLPENSANEAASLPGAPHAGSRIRVLYLGRLSWKKGLEGLVRAIGKRGETELILAGPDDERYAGRLAALAHSVGAADRVRWIGEIHGDEKDACLRAADLLALPSRSENFGNALLEGLAHGTPGLCTPEVGAAEIIADSNAGYIVQGSSESIEAALSSFGRLAPDDRSAMNERARCAALPFDWEAIAQRMSWAYEAASRGAQGEGLENAA